MFKKWRKSSKNEDNAGLYDMEIVKLHMPQLLERRNGSTQIVTVSPEMVQHNYDIIKRESQISPRHVKPKWTNT